MELGGAPNTWKPFSNSFAKIKVAHGHFFDKKNQQNAHELQNYQNLTILKSRKRRQECSGIFFSCDFFFKNHHPPIDLVWDYYSRNKWP